MDREGFLLARLRVDQRMGAFMHDGLLFPRWVPDIRASNDPHDGRCGIDVSMREERSWPPEKIRGLPEFHALVWRTGQAQPQPVYCAPYWTLPELRGRYDPDPYHPADVASGKNAGMLTATVAAAAMAAGAWAVTPSHVWRDVMMDFHAATTVARSSPTCFGRASVFATESRC
jgi:hypothetical protein